MKEKVSEGICLVLFCLVIIGGISLLNNRFEDLNMNNNIELSYNK